MVINSNKPSNDEMNQKDDIMLNRYLNKNISKNFQDPKLLSHENKNLKHTHNTQGTTNFVDSNNKNCKEVPAKNMRNESSCKTGGENNLNKKNGSYMNFLKKNVRSVISNITGGLILGRQNDTELKNRQLNKQPENSNRKGENKINEKKEASGEPKKGTNNIINIKEKNNDKQFKKWNTKGITNNTPKLNNVNNSSMSNLKKGTDFTKYKSLVNKKTSPIHENIRDITKRNIQDIIKKKVNENNKPGKEVSVMPLKKMNYQFPLTTHNSINQKILDNLKKAPPPNTYMLNRKVKMDIKTINDNKIKSNLNNNIKEHKNKSFLLKGLNKNEKIPYKKGSYTPTYMSNRNKKLTQHEDLKIIKNDDTFHKNLKKMLINTIMNPENEEKNNKVIMSNKKDSSPFLKRQYNNVTYKGSPINKGQNNLMKNKTPIETKQEMLKRYSTAVRNRNLIIIKSNNMTQYSNTNTSNVVIDVEDIGSCKNKKQTEDTILIDEEAQGKENIQGYKVIGGINSNADLENLKRYRTNKNIFEELIQRNLNKDEKKHVILKSIENFKASYVSPLNRTIDKDGKNKNEKINTPINNILKIEKYQNIKEELYYKKGWTGAETDRLPLHDTSLSKISNLLPNKIIFSSLDKEYPIVKRDPTIWGNKDTNSFPPKNETLKEMIQNGDTHFNEYNKFDEVLKDDKENVQILNDEGIEEELKCHDKKIISNSSFVSNDKIDIDGNDLGDDKSEGNSNQSNELDDGMDNNNLKNSEKNKSLNHISFKQTSVDIDNDIDEIVAIFKETIIDKINDEESGICASDIIGKEDSHKSILPYNENNMNTLNSSTFVPIPKGDKMGSNMNELLNNEDNTNAHIDVKLEESQFNIEKNINLQKNEEKECEKLEYETNRDDIDNNQHQTNNTKLVKGKRKKWEYIKKHISYIKTQEAKYLINDTYNDSKKFGITYCLGSDENETNSVTLLNDGKILHKNKMCVNFSKPQVGKYSSRNNKISNKIFSLNKYPNKIILRRKKYIMNNFSFNLKKNYNLSLNNQNVNFFKIKKGKFYDKNEKFHTKKNKIDVINLETQIGSNTSIDNSSGYITKNRNICGNNNTKKRKIYLPLEKNNTQNYEQIRSKKINSMHSLQACVLSQMDDEIKDSQEILTSQSVIYKIEDGVTENGGEKKVEVVNLASSEDSEQNMHTKENASTVEDANQMEEPSHSDRHESVFNSLQFESDAFENLYNGSSSKEDIFFYEHEWVNIILQLINNNNLGLGENLMILLFQKEEQLYKSFINDEVECKSSSDENLFVKSEECIKKDDEAVSSFGINNKENNRKKQKISKKLSSFMQQICMKCPLDWPLLDIGMLIIVSQIVCYIFNNNKIHFFFDACRMFEKYCLGILLNSSLICTKKSGSLVFMFEHEFFYQIVIPKNYKISKEVIKYHSSYLKNDNFIQEKTILDYIFLALACYITISQNLKDYIENNNIIYYLNFFHKGIDTDDASGAMSDIFPEKKLKRKRTEERSSERNDVTTDNPFGRTIFSDTTYNFKNDCSIKHGHSECMHKYKNSSDYINKEKNRNKTYEKKRKKRLSILRTPRCIKKLKKIKGISKIENNSDFEELNSSSQNNDNQLNQDGWIKKKKRTKYSKVEKNELNCLFKNRKIDTIVKYHTKTKFEKLLCLIIIEIFNLIYDNRKYTIENILIIRKFFRIFLNYAQKRFISLSIYIHSNKSKKKSLHTSQNQDCRDRSTDTYCNNRETCTGYDFRVNEPDSFIPMPSYIYENYYNMWVWIERIFCEHFYQINNMIFNFFSFEKNEIDSKKLIVDYNKLELINRNIKRFSSLQKRNSFILKEYWTIFGLKKRNNESSFSFNNNLKSAVKNNSNILEEGNEFLPGSIYSKKLLPNCYSFEELSGKNKLFYELEKKDQEYDMLCSYFLSSIHCICKTYLSMGEIPSFLHLKNENNVILDNSIISLNGINLSFTKTELKKEHNEDNEIDATLKGDKDRNENEEETAKNSSEYDENSVLWLRQLKKRLKVYDIRWHEEYEKKYFNLLNCINLLKKQFKKNKLFYKIMKNNISSIWLSKIQIYLQYIQIAINCKFVLGYTYNNIYLFIKKNYSFVITIIEHYMSSKMGVATAAISVEKADQASENNDKDVNNDIGQNNDADPNNDKDCSIGGSVDESDVSSILDFPIEIGEFSIDENFLLTAWEIANFYFCILYYKLELKTILTEILKWITFFEKIGTKYSQELFKFRCSSYILHILILMNKYEAAQKMMKHISCHYIKNEDGEDVTEENREDLGGRRCILSYLKKNKMMDKRSLESLSILKEESDSGNENKKGGDSTVENLFPYFEKKKILLSHIINKCYLYNKWVNYMIMKYNKVLIYLLKRKNIVKLILFNKKNVSILMNRRKEKILIKNISKHMIKLQNVLLFLYYLSIKLYKSYYYHSSILHNNTSKQILEASKYLNIKIKKKQIIMNYITSFQTSQNCQTYKSGEINMPMSYIASTPMYVSNLSEQFPSATLFKSTSLSCDNKLISTNAPTIPISSNWCIKTERDDSFLFVNSDSKVTVRNDSNCTNSSQNNDDMFYLHALILSIQIQYTLSICIILCSDLFIAPRKVNRLMKMKNCVKKKKLKSANFVLSLFSYKLLCKHYRIINGHAYKKRKERSNKEDSATSPIEDMEEENNPKYCEDKFNDLTNKPNMNNTNCSAEVETNNENILSNKSFINNDIKECYDNEHADELGMPSQEHFRQIDENKISDYSTNMSLKRGSNKKREGYKSETLNDKLINEFEKMNDANYLSDFVPGKYENYKKNILKKKNYNNIYENLFILRKNKIKNVITKKNNYHVLVKISTWLSKNSVSQLTWIAEKLFKMCLPEMLCVVLGLQANMLVNKNILAVIKKCEKYAQSG